MIPRPGRSAVAAISTLGIATALGAGFVFLAQAILARRLGPSDYGLFASSLATVTMVAPLAGFGLSQFRLRVYGAEGWTADRWLTASLRFTAWSALLTVGLVVAWALFGGPVDASTRSMLLLLCPVILGVLAVNLVSSKMRLEDRYAALAGLHLLMPGGRLLVALLALLIPAMTVYSVALGYCAVALLVVALSLAPTRAMLRGEMRLQGHGPRVAAPPRPVPAVAELWREAWPYGVAAILYPVFFQVSTVLVKYINGDAQAGRYGIAMAVMTAIYLLPATIYQKFLLSKLHRWAVHDKPKFWRIHRQGNLAMLLLGLVVGAGLAATAPLLVPLAFGEQYRGVAAILMVLALAIPVRFLSTSVGSALLTGGHMRYRVRAMATATFAAIALNAMLIPVFDEFGAAAATVAAELLLLSAMYRGVRRVKRSAEA
ncbi:polysaccharide biosynthesis C-terminal domain-containing protein [Luteimonas salinilitoris]|uniref:Polysaccharide biosynthesis C-terminal domain-containing protein n=1 Tax=Luteimonas salinilitoris TaxID=3237697 RepID=A0ABV4HQ16_9GAMM